MHIAIESDSGEGTGKGRKRGAGTQYQLLEVNASFIVYKDKGYRDFWRGQKVSPWTCITRSMADRSYTKCWKQQITP